MAPSVFDSVLNWIYDFKIALDDEFNILSHLYFIYVHSPQTLDIWSTSLP